MKAIAEACSSLKIFKVIMVIYLEWKKALPQTLICAESSHKHWNKIKFVLQTISIIST